MKCAIYLSILTHVSYLYVLWYYCGSVCISSCVVFSYVFMIFFVVKNFPYHRNRFISPCTRSPITLMKPDPCYFHGGIKLDRSGNFWPIEGAYVALGLCVTVEKNLSMALTLLLYVEISKTFELLINFQNIIYPFAILQCTSRLRRYFQRLVRWGALPPNEPTNPPRSLLKTCVTFVTNVL